MAAVLGGPLTWGLDRDDDGYRTYRVTYRVQAAISESPVAVMNASGLPSTGSPFNISGYTGVDNWVWCRPEMSVKIDQEKSGDPAVYYLVECVFSNKWEGKSFRRCNDTPIEDPLLEPMKISGSFGKSQWEARYDKDGLRLVSSASEPFIGPGVTFDYVKPTVRIEQNVASLGLSTFAAMVNTVNANPLWGVPARCVKLVNAPWDRKAYGVCNFFYTRTFEFEIDNYNQDKDGNPIGFDREIYDAGSMCLAGEWIVDKGDPNYGGFKFLTNTTETTAENILKLPQAKFKAYKDMSNERARVILDGKGRPANALLVAWNGVPCGLAGDPASKILKYYRESNFLLLGIPTSF